MNKINNLINRLLNFKNSSSLESVLRVTIVILLYILTLPLKIVMYLVGYKMCTICGEYIMPFEKRIKRTFVHCDFSGSGHEYLHIRCGKEEPKC
jgi:hypothetical protein